VGYMPVPSVTAGQPAAGNASVLIVEDDLGIAAQLVRALSRGGYQVEHVVTGREALHRPDPDVVLLDLELPDTDGVAVCRELRQRSDAAILVVTAHGEEADRIVALDAGADDYLVKPFGLGELLARIRPARGRHQDAEGDRGR
jgi:DNA-binding response OmpR family regulator